MRSIKVKYDRDASKYQDLHDDGRFASVGLPEEMKAMARFVVAGNALNKEDYTLLTDMLGISPNHDDESYER